MAGCERSASQVERSDRREHEQRENCRSAEQDHHACADVRSDHAVGQHPTGQPYKHARRAEHRDHGQESSCARGPPRGPREHGDEGHGYEQRDDSRRPRRDGRYPWRINHVVGVRVVDRAVTDRDPGEQGDRRGEQG